MRSQEIDILRGIAVFGVVFNHTLGGLVGAGYFPSDSLAADINQWFYIFRMPTIAFVLGLFVARSVEKYSPRGYLKRRVKFALYIYLVWYLIQMGLEIVASRLTTTPVTLQQALSVWIMPSHLWFIPYIAVSTLILVLLRPWEPGRWWASVLILLLSIALWGVNPDVFGLRGASLLIFSFIGATLTSKRLAFLYGEYRKFIFISGATALLVNVLIYAYLSENYLHAPTANIQLSDKNLYAYWQVVSFISAVLGVIFLIALAAFLALIKPVNTWLAFMGQRTLEIYLAHVAVISVMRIALGKFGLEIPSLIFLICLLSGILIPLILEKVSQNNKLRLLFELPANKKTSQIQGDPRNHSQGYLTREP